jgi:6-pyruvoyltetrahydropterin/6-carboxytetrahydropterin synthase
VANTTAELIAHYIASRLRSAFAAKGLKSPRLLRVEVEECSGQSAVVEW